MQVLPALRTLGCAAGAGLLGGHVGLVLVGTELAVLVGIGLVEHLGQARVHLCLGLADGAVAIGIDAGPGLARSEEHTSELQSQSNLVCRLLLEKKNNNCPL